MEISDLTPEHFKQLPFAQGNQGMFDAYIKARVQGYDGCAAFVRAFGSHGFKAEMLPTFAVNVETNPYFVVEFQKALASTPFGEMWNAKTAVHEMLQLARGQFIKDAVRLQAQKELNVMVGIVVIDENGKTRAGRSLDDFYDALDAKREAEAKAQRDAKLEALYEESQASPESQEPAEPQDAQEGTESGGEGW